MKDCKLLLLLSISDIFACLWLYQDGESRAIYRPEPRHCWCMSTFAGISRSHHQCTGWSRLSTRRRLFRNTSQSETGVLSQLAPSPELTALSQPETPEAVRRQAKLKQSEVGQRRVAPTDANVPSNKLFGMLTGLGSGPTVSVRREKRRGQREKTKGRRERHNQEKGEEERNTN